MILQVVLVWTVCFSGFISATQATEQDDSSLMLESKLPESEPRLGPVSFEDSNSTANPSNLNVNSTDRPSFTTARPVCINDCLNGGSKVCPRFGWGYCLCFRGFHGSRCQFNPTNFPPRFTTRRPSFYTPRWFRGKFFKRCYSCYNAPSQRHCLSQRTVFCRGECFSGMATLRASGRTYYFAGCRYSFNRPGRCRRTCDEAFRRGLASRCTISCCYGDLCNGGGRPTRPYPTRRPTARPQILLRVICRLLKITKSIIEGLNLLLKSHMGKNQAREYKREVTSMMSKVNFHAQNLEDSRDPEVLRIKQDIGETRMRAQAVIRKLDEFIDEDTYGDKQK